MPIYEYQCNACGHQLEALQRMTDDALIHCPECNSETLKKKISAAGFQLKGTGWYETDFKNSGSKPAANGAAEKAGKENNNPAKKGSTAAEKSGNKSSKSGASSRAA